MSFAKQQELSSNSKFRSFTSSVEKVLKNFEYSSEWADLISALGKLNKVLQANSKFGAIPKCITVGKRLSQCMHPALPSGVHLKAIDVYDTIFKILGPQSLKSMLSIYSSGLFSLYANASTPVRPVLLNLFEVHLLPLGKSLIIFLDGLLLGLLPGLEEGSEHFDRVNALLSSILKTVDASSFYSSIWRCILSSPWCSLPRVTAVQLILRHFDRSKSMDDQIHFIGNDIETMVYALCEALRDGNILTQRSALDILLYCFPLSSIAVSRSDIVTLLSSAMFVVLRRDMSLNRRLYSWILGTEANKSFLRSISTSSDVTQSYFESTSSQIVCEALKNMLKKQSEAFQLVTSANSLEILVGTEVKLLRVLISLLDKAEIGPLIIPEVMTQTIRLVISASNAYNLLLAKDKENSLAKRGNSELVKTVNLFISSFEAEFIWAYMMGQFADACSENKEPSNEANLLYFEVCDVTDILLTIITLETYPEVSTKILPHFLQSIIEQLNVNCLSLTLEQILRSLQTMSKILLHIQPAQPDENSDSQNYEPNMKSCSEAFQNFLPTFITTKILPDNTIVPSYIDTLKKRNQGQLLPSEDTKMFACKNNPNLPATFSALCKVFIDCCCFPSFCHGDAMHFYKGWLDDDTNQETCVLPDWLQHLLAVACYPSLCPMKQENFFKEVAISAATTILQLISITSKITETPGPGKQSHSAAKGVVSVVVIPLIKPIQLRYLHEDLAFYVSICSMLWQEIDLCKTDNQQLAVSSLLLKLHNECPDDTVERHLLGQITSKNQSTRTQAVKRFCKLWELMRILAQSQSSVQQSEKTFSRCLFVVIDILNLSKSALDQAGMMGHSSVINQSIVTCMVSSWLRQCIEEGDICHLLEPYLLVVLNPRTHRISYRATEHQSKNTDLNRNLHSTFLRDQQARKSTFPALLQEMKGFCSQDKSDDENSVESRDGCGIEAQIAEGKRSYTEILNLLSLQDSTEYEEKSKEVDSLSFEDSQQDSDLPNPRIERTSSVSKFSSTETTSAKSLSLQFHVYVYQEHFDTSQVLFGLQSILAISSEHPSLFAFTACTTSLASGSHLSHLLQDLLVRHERAISNGTSFYEGTKLSARSSLRNQMMVEILVSICLYYIRSTFLHEPDSYYNNRNYEVQCTASRLLTSIVRQLSTLACDDSLVTTQRAAKSSAMTTTQSFHAFLNNVFEMQQVQKSVMTCLVGTVLSLKALESNNEFSDPSNHLKCECGTDMEIIKQWTGSDQSCLSAIFSHLLELTFSIIVLEHHIFSGTSDGVKTDHSGLTDAVEEGTEPYHEHPGVCCRLLTSAHQYDPGEKLAAQNVFISTLLEVYKINCCPELHTECSTLLVSVLPCLRPALPYMVTPLLAQFCRNVETACRIRNENNEQTHPYPPQYVESTVKSMCVLVHDCLLIGGLASQSSDKESSSSLPSNTTNSASGLSSIFGVFNSAKTTKTTAVDDNELSGHAIATRNAVLHQLVRIVSCMSSVWQYTQSDKLHQDPLNLLPTIDDTKLLSYNVTQLIGPLAFRYGEHLLCSLAVLWEAKSQDVISLDNPSSAPTIQNATVQQEALLDLLSGVRALSLDNYLLLVQKSIKAPPSSVNQNKKVIIEENILHMMMCYLRRQKSKALLDSWPLICSIVREAVSFTGAAATAIDSLLTPRCYNIFLLMLVDFVKAVPQMNNKKDQKDLQEVVEKCIETCNTIAGSSLEQSNWIRRNLSVIPGKQLPSATKITAKVESSVDQNGGRKLETSNNKESDPTVSLQRESDERSVPTTLDLQPSEKSFDKFTTHEIRFEHSIQSLSVLSQVVANLLDVIYGNDERDRVIPVLAPIMINVLPYLRNHSHDNVPSFRACTTFLSSISGFQHTRRVWRKDVLDLVLDPLFFKMSLNCTPQWQVIVDHLMTHDKTTFKEFLSRISLPRSGSSTPISIFTNKEQEMEQRAMHLKRLAFVIFSSEADQYHRQLPEIQERLSECLRLYNAPVVLQQVFLCFRVLLLRISPHNLTSLWPTIYTELTHALLQLEQSLQTIEHKSTDDKNSRLDLSDSGQHNGATASWYNMYLSACKLLDMLLCLPCQYVPMFQLYRWCFVGETDEHDEEPTDAAESGDENLEKNFVPYCVRIQTLLNKNKPENANSKLQIKRGRLLLTLRRLKSLQQLQLFFNTVTSQSLLLKTQKTLPLSPSKRKGAGNNETFDILGSVEKLLDKDFVEAML